MKATVTVLHESGKESVLSPWLLHQHLRLVGSHAHFDGEAYNEGRADKGVGFQVTAEYVTGHGMTSGFDIEDLLNALRSEKIFSAPWRLPPMMRFRRSLVACCISLRGSANIFDPHAWWEYDH